MTLDTPHSTLHTPYSELYTLHFTLHTLHFTVHTLHFTLSHYTLHFTLRPHNLTLFTRYAVLDLGWASFSCCARTPTSRPQLWFCTALLLPALPKVHSDAEGGPLNLPQSLVIMLAMLSFLIFFVQQYRRIVCSYPRPLQHTSPQYVGLDVHLANMSQLQTRSSTLTKKLHNCAAPFVFSCQGLCQASFRPFPFGLKSTRTNVSF